MDELEQIRQAVEVLEALRPSIGDEAVDTALAPLRQRLTDLSGGPVTAATRLKFATVLMVDVIDSTRLSRHLDAEDMHAILRGAMRRFGRVIESHDGYVNANLGDGLLTIFGHAVTREDDAERAIRAGLALLAEAQEHARWIEEKWGLTGFDIRIGVDSGQIMLSAGDEAESQVIGMPIHMASRMESAAPPGGLRITANTYRHIQDLFEVQGELLDVKGRDRPVQTYLVLHAQPRRFEGFKRGVVGLETRTIGRDEELRQLQASFEAARRDKAIQVITISGQPGVGKSRLLYEFDRQIRDKYDYVNIFKGRAVQRLSQTPYSLFQFLLAHRFGIRTGDPAEAASQALEEGLSAVIAEEPKMKAHVIGSLLGFDLPDSQYLRGLRDDPGQLRRLGLVYLAQYFAAAAEQGPAAIYLEDLHWADGPSLDAIQFIVAENARSPLLIIALARPDLFERRPGWMMFFEERGIDHGRLDLAPLSESDSLRLAHEILRKVDALPETLVERLVSQADGNPFYVEELVKVLIDDGVIIRGEGEDPWRVETGRLRDLRIPSTLTAVLESRLDTLPASERVLLQKAAVVGRVFWDGALAALAQGETPVSDLLASLSRRELIHKRAVSTFSGADEYIFKHSLLQEVTHDTVLKPQRKRYHGQAAAWLEEAVQRGDRQEGFAAIIAGHYEQAGRRDAAADFYMRAGDRAQGQGAPHEARAFFDRVLALIDSEDLERRWRGLLGRNEALGLLGEREARQADDEALVALAMRREDANGLAEAYYRQGYYYSILGDERKALDIYHLGLAAAVEAGDRRLQAIIQSLMAVSQFRLGSPSGAAGSAEKALEMAHDVEDDEVLSRVMANVSVYISGTGDLARAVQLQQQQITLNRQMNKRVGEVIGLSNMGYNYGRLGLLQESRRALEDALEIGEAIGARQLAQYARLNLGLAYWRTGKYEKAHEILSQAIEGLKAFGDAFGRAAGETYFGLSLEKTGEMEEAGRYFQRAMEGFYDIGQNAYARGAQAGLIRCYLAGNDLAGVRRHVAELWEYLASGGANAMEFPALAFTTCAEAFGRLGDEERAAQAIVAGHDDLMKRAEKISDPVWRRSFLENLEEHRALVGMKAARSAVEE